MDVQQTLEFMRSRNRAEIELPSGLGARIGLSRIQDAMLAGHIPLPVMREMEKLSKAQEAQTDEDLPPEVLAQGTWLRKEMVRRTLKALAPSVAELNGADIDMPMEVIDELAQADFDLLAEYAMRTRDFPTPASPSE